MHRQSLPVAVCLLALVACGAQAPPDYAARYQPLIDVYIAAWNDGDMGSLDAVVATDVVRHSPGGLITNGPDGLRHLITEFRTAYPDLQVVIDDSSYLDDRSFHMWTFTGTNTGPGAASPTGRSVKMSGSSALRYKDGKIVEEIVYYDALDLQTQLGYTLMPPAPALAAATQ